MKKLFVYIIVFICILPAAAQAQLPSARPMSSTYSPTVKKKLDQPKAPSARPAVLPSQQEMPKAVTNAKPAGAGKQEKILTEAEKKKKLPSSGKKLPQARRPQKP